MPSYSTKIIYTDSHSQSSNVTESGTPSYIALQGLSSNEQYSVKGELYDGLQKVAESSTSTFTTLAAGTISLTYVSTTRSGNNYIVKYTISSTYAMSNIVLVTNSNNFQGIIAGNEATFTVTGLTYGNDYPYIVTAKDIYNETTTATGTITTADYQNDYFTVTDLSGSSNKMTITFHATNDVSSQLTEFFYSTDGGSTWTSVTSTKAGVNIPINANSSVLLKHNGTIGNGDSRVWNEIKYSSFKCSGRYKVSGNIASLAYGDSFAGTKSMTDINFIYLFNSDTNLVSAKDLYFGAFTTLEAYCYEYMFQGCTSLVEAPQLPATTLAVWCYHHMFENCSSLAVAPQLPAMTLSNDCYCWMFRGCTSLASAPELPASTLSKRCYYRMFSGCTSLVTPAVLSHVTSLEQDCCTYMFAGCSSLSTAYAPSVSSWDSYKMEDWLYGVAQSGTLYASTIVASSIPTNSTSGCPTGWTIPTNEYFTVTNISNSNADVTLTARNANDATEVYVSTDGGTTWVSKTSSTSGTALATLAPNDKMLMKHTGAMFTTSGNTINCTQDFDVSGNIASLSFGDSFNTGSYLSMQQNAYRSLFQNETHVKHAHNLSFGSFNEISQTGCAYMFNGCTGLLSPPDFTIITSVQQSGFESIFYGCSSLQYVSRMKNVNGARKCAFIAMYKGCTTITSAENVDFANFTSGSANESAFQSMFENCTSLVTPFKHMPTSSSMAWETFKYTFMNCTSLTSVPDATGMTKMDDKTFLGMFYGCTSLTEGLDIRNITYARRPCLNDMYNGCTHIVKVYLPNIPTYYSSGMTSTNWLNNVAASGEIISPSSALSETVPANSTSGCPTGWTVVTV